MASVCLGLVATLSTNTFTTLDGFYPLLLTVPTVVLFIPHAAGKSLCPPARHASAPSWKKISALIASITAASDAAIVLPHRFHCPAFHPVSEFNKLLMPTYPIGLCPLYSTAPRARRRPPATAPPSTGHSHRPQATYTAQHRPRPLATGHGHRPPATATGHGRPPATGHAHHPTPATATGHGHGHAQKSFPHLATLTGLSSVAEWVRVGARLIPLIDEAPDNVPVTRIAIFS